MTVYNTAQISWTMDCLNEPVQSPVEEKQKGQPQYYDNILDTIGETPLVRLRNVIPNQIQGTVLAKIEAMNPGGSIKDRVARNMIETAEREGRLMPGGTIIEATSGNTGIGLATVAATKGYKAILVMPDRMSREKVNYLRAIGAEVILAPSVAPEDPRNNMNVAADLAVATPNSLWTNQYKNRDNPAAHYATTGPEIWRQTAGQIKVLVAGMGTGGTISGTGKYLKEQNSDIKVVGVDVRGSLIKESWEAGHQVDEDGYDREKFMVEGIGKYFIPETMNLSIADEIIRLEDKDCFLMARNIAHNEGIFAGGSSGGAVAGAIRSRYVQALRPGELAVVILPDSGNRYVSRIYNDDWMRENEYMD